MVTGVERWTSAEFLAEATAWTAEVAGAHGIDLTGDREQPHARSWSTAIRFGAAGGPVWLKANGSGTAHEPALLALLDRLEPGLGPDVLAVDHDRAWTLMRDAGHLMRGLGTPDQLWPHWTTVLRRYASAQVRLARRAEALRAAGVPDAGPRVLPSLAAGLVAELGSRPVGHGGLDGDQVRRLEAMLPTYEAWCTELAGSGIADTLDHSDLHSANVCWSDSGPRVVDWGDAVVGHPFATMLATLNSIAWHAGTDVEDPRVLAARDAYLEAFAGDGPDADDLARYVVLARRTGCVVRALSYRRAFDGVPLAAQGEEGDWPVRGWLLELLELLELPEP